MFREAQMDSWRTKALETFPELEDKIVETSGIVDLWIELYCLLQAAYEERPVNDTLIGNVYDYAAWCINQPQEKSADLEDPSSAAAVGLIENIPLNKQVSDDSYRWLSVETFAGCEALFRYHLSDEEYRKFSDEFMRKKKAFVGPSRL
jgi:hypothetical protein